MSATTNKQRVRWSLVCVVSVIFSVVATQDSRAVDPAKLRQQEQTRTDAGSEQAPVAPNRSAEEHRLRDVRDRVEGVRDRHADFNQQGAPAIRPRWPRPQQWMLGVRVWYLETGARVTHAFRNTPAWRVGLEPRDVIVSIDGYQIGYVNRRFYEISNELNARAGRTGWVRLLVQNCRNNQLVNLDVQLARMGAGFPRERFGIPDNARIDQADEAGGQRDAMPSRQPQNAEQPRAR